MMGHTRVIPRDFFNESKLLKSLGQFQLCVHDRTCGGLPLTIEFDGKPFSIFQNPADGSLFVSNYRVFLNTDEIYLKIPYNSREKYPLEATYKGGEYYIFDSKGKFMPNFGYFNKDK